MNKINLFILNPSNLSQKYKLEHELQKIFYENTIFQIYYIPSKYPELKFFNKLLSIFDFSFDYPENSFYCDHDVFLKNDYKFFQNLFENKIFLNYTHQTYNWEDVFKNKLDLKIKPKTHKRLSSCFFPLYSNILKEIYNEINEFKKINPDFFKFSGTFEEYFFSIPIQNNKTLPLKVNNFKEKICVLHYKIPNSFNLELLKKNLKSKKILQDLRNIYKRYKK